METTVMENQMEKKMENEMETGIIYGILSGGLLNNLGARFLHMGCMREYVEPLPLVSYVQGFMVIYSWTTGSWKKRFKG